MRNPNLTMPLLERYRINPSTIHPDEILDALERLQSLDDALDAADLTDDPDNINEIAAAVEELIDRAVKYESERFENHSDYVDFFNECVNALNGFWPAAEVTDDNLRQVILDAITKGDQS